jgi:hypothetical protein
MRLSEEKVEEERSKDNTKIVKERVEKKEEKESKEKRDTSDEDNEEDYEGIVMRRVREMRRNSWKERAQRWRGK